MTQTKLSQKRILIYGSNYFPEPIGIPRYTTEMAEDFAAQGYSVVVIAAAPLYPTWTKKVGYKYRTYSRETRNGVLIRRVPTYVPHGSSFFQRVIYEVVYFLFSLPLVVWHAVKGIDALVVTTPPLILCLSLLTPLRDSRKAVIVKDLQIDIAESMHILRGKLLFSILYKVERFVLERADLITAVSLGMLARLKAKSLRKPNLEFFPDWVDTDRLVRVPSTAAMSLRAKLGLKQDATIVGYSGNIARKQGLELLVEIARRFQEKGRVGIQFLICGDGPAKAGLVDLVAKLKLANVVFAPLQSEADLPILLSAIDVHTVIQKDEVSDLVMPGKMFNIMSCSGAMIITAPAGSAIDGVATASKAIIRVDRDDTDGLEREIDDLCDNPAKREAMGHSGRVFVLKDMGKRAILDKFLAQIFGEANT